MLLIVQLLAVQTAALAVFFHQVAGQCVDLVQDCGGKADNHSDNAQAFVVCQHLASQQSGCITVPAGLFRISQVTLNTSNIDIRVDNDVVFLPLGNVGALFYLGNVVPSSEEYVQNISFHGQAPGQFTIDISISLATPWNTRGLSFEGGLKNFVLANMLCKMSDPIINPQTTSLSNNPCIASHHRSFGTVRLNPQLGVLQNLTCLGCTAGYGLIQLHSGEKMSFANLFSQGGVTLRLETGGDGLGYVGDITAKNLTCANGSAVLSSSPHAQQNGAYHLENLLALSCKAAIGLVGGYSQHGFPPGHYSNESTISNVVSVYGTHAQNSSRNEFGPSCAPCLTPNAPLNYHVSLTGLKAVGYPPPSNRTKCYYYHRWQGCPFNRHATERRYPHKFL